VPKKAPGAGVRGQRPQQRGSQPEGEEYFFHNVAR
jgi:hypothetical protein